MKSLVLLILLMVSSIANSSDIEGDINNDGVLSGSEQYLSNNPPSIKADRADRAEITQAIRELKIEQEAAAANAARNYAIQQAQIYSQRYSNNNSSSSSSSNSSSNNSSNSSNNSSNDSNAKRTQLDEQQKREQDRRDREINDEQARLNQQQRSQNTPTVQQKSVVPVRPYKYEAKVHSL